MGDTATRLIFIIEDDEAVRASTRSLLEARGYGVREFASAERLLEAGNCRQAECLVLDDSLPGLSGIDLIEELRAQGVRTPAIIMTANGRQILARAAQASVAAVLRKPLAADGLLQWLEQIFANTP